MATKKALTPPFLIMVGDYHEFYNVQMTLNLIEPRIKVVELSDVSGLSKQASDMLENLQPYIGLVYIGRVPSNAKIVELLSADEEIPEVWG